MAYFIDETEYSYEEYKVKLVEIKAHVALINSYVQKILDGVITLNDVPAEYYDEVYYRLYPPVIPEPDPDQDFIDRLISEVNSDGY